MVKVMELQWNGMRRLNALDVKQNLLGNVLRDAFIIGLTHSFVLIAVILHRIDAHPSLH